MGIYNVMFIGGLILAILFLALTVVLFFVLKIPTAYGSVTGKTQKKAIEEIKAGKSAETGAGSARRRRRSAQSGNITARDVNLASATGTLQSQSGDLPKKAAPKAERDANSDIVRQAEREAAMAAGIKIPEDSEPEKKKTVKVNPKTGRRYELDNEETEILTYGVTGNNNSEGPTSVLSPNMPGEEEATDLLRSGVSDEDLYDSDLDEESTDILTSGVRVDYEEDSTDVLTPDDGYEADSASASGREDIQDGDEATDVLTSGMRPGDGSEDATDILTDDEADTSADTFDKPKGGITDMLINSMREGDAAAAEAATAVLGETSAGRDTDDDGSLSQSDVHGTLDADLTSVLKSDMMPGAEASAAASKIRILYSKTIVHTDETL